MTSQISDYFESSHSSVLSEMELLNSIKGLPALIFRIEMVKNRIEYLNDYRIEGLGEKTFLLLKNHRMSSEIIFEQDMHLYESFIRSIHDGKPAITVFRIKTGTGDHKWIKLTGGPNSYNPGYFLGMIVDITPSITLIEDMNRKEDEQQTMLNLADNPVVLVDMNAKQIISQNIAAQELFGYTIDEFRNMDLYELVHPKSRVELTKSIEEIIFEKKWEGTILYQRKGKSHFLGKTTLRSLKIKEKRLMRISIYSFDQAAGKPSLTEEGKPAQPLSESRKKYIRSLVRKVEPLSDMRKILETLLHNPYKHNPYDGIIYSDVQMKKGQVTVYGVGTCLENLKFGESFAFEGTIAENIEQYKLDSLIVDDTMSSIKAIDWALFTPYGIRSYFAKPFYERNTLRSILILCSKTPNAFSDEHKKDYELLYEPFVKGLKNYRKALRSKR